MVEKIVQFMINIGPLTHVVLEPLLGERLGEDRVGSHEERNNSMNIPSKLTLFLLQAYRLIILRPSCKKRLCLLLMTAMFFLASSVLQEEKMMGLLPVSFW